jgi:hypothetical protein
MVVGGVGSNVGWLVGLREGCKVGTLVGARVGSLRHMSANNNGMLNRLCPVTAASACLPPEEYPAADCPGQKVVTR